jgi:2-polyprenyl-6-methoxyphenol hydroxylase-like FAD-dependent oxidoreductase
VTSSPPAAADPSRAEPPGSGPEPPIVVVGAGVGGLGVALALGASHRVILIERDATPLPEDADAAFAWDRRGAPQVRHSHALLARLRNLLRDRHPEVLADLLAAGATEIRFLDGLPVEITDRAPRPGDEDLVALACRRTTFEWVLRRRVQRSGTVELRDGTAVVGLVSAVGDLDGPGRPGSECTAPRVAGVRVRPAGAADDHPSETIDARLVVAALGRRSAVPGWLGELGVALDVDEEDTGLIYLSRFYRRHADAELPAAAGPVAGDLGYLKFAIFQGDNDTHSVTFALDAGDAELRAHLIDPDGFDRAAAAIESIRPWIEPSLSAPMTDVHVMGGLINRRVSYLDPDGDPRVLGFHAVGDAHTCTNPLYGRGCSLAMVQADLLADALDAHPGGDTDSLVARSVDYERASVEQVLPWYRAALNQDRLGRAAALERAAERDPARDATADQGLDTTPGAGVDGGASSADQAVLENAAEARDFMQAIMRDGLMVAVRTDATVFRAFLRSFNLLEPPDQIMTDPEVVNRVLAAYQTRDERPPEPPFGPDRTELVDLLNRRPT